MKTFVYMMTNRSRVVLYTGVTDSLERRTWYHRSGKAKTFTKTYKVDEMVRMLNPKWKDLGKNCLVQEAEK